MIGFEGPQPSAEVRQLIREHAVGGIILFSRNVEEPVQVAELVRELQTYSRASGQDLPLLVGVDQEGGRVARFRAPWTLWPPLRLLGRIDSEELARRMGAALARELRPLGVGCDFAPVMDVDSNPKNPVIGDRSFGDDAARVGRLGAALIQGLQEGGIAAVAKHFPGHGDTGVDSHLDLPVVDHSRSRLEEVELRPFRDAVAAGVSMVMTAHLLVREIDDSLPATLSPRIVEGVLREELAFGGVVATDDLEMGAVAKRWSPATAARLAVAAGCDLLVISRSADAQAEAHEALVRAVESGELTWRRLDDAYERVRRLKQRFLLPYVEPDPHAAKRAAGHPEHQALAQMIADRAGAPA
jgi:beta-N-acetylhexosaminidase